MTFLALVYLDATRRTSRQADLVKARSDLAVEALALQNIFQNMLLKNPGYTIPKFTHLFQADFTWWMGRERQFDDLLLIGIEV